LRYGASAGNKAVWGGGRKVQPFQIVTHLRKVKFSLSCGCKCLWKGEGRWGKEGLCGRKGMLQVEGGGVVVPKWCMAWAVAGKRVRWAK